MQARFARCVRGLRSVSTFQRGPHDPYNALTRRFEPRAEKKGPLAGWEVSIKENISMKDVATTCSSRMLQDYHAPYNAAVVDRLEASGALITSRNNCDEFAMGYVDRLTQRPECALRVRPRCEPGDLRGCDGPRLYQA